MERRMPLAAALFVAFILGAAIAYLVTSALQHRDASEPPAEPTNAEVTQLVRLLERDVADLHDRVVQWQGRDSVRSSRARKAEPDPREALRAAYPRASNRFIDKKLRRMATSEGTEN